MSHEPTDEIRQVVKLHAMVGTPQEMIAQILDIDAKTLRKHYRAELDTASSQANAIIGGALFNKARAGDTTAMIFWMKTRAGWRETLRVQPVAPDDPAFDTSLLSDAALQELLDARILSDQGGDDVGEDEV